MPLSEERKARRREQAKAKYALDPETHRAYAREQHHKHKEAKSAAMKEYRERNKDRIRVQQKEWRDANKELAKRNNLKKTGFTPELLQELLEFQNYKCAICEDDFNSRPSKHTHADHCHVTQTPRGVLCTQCNTGIGLLKDDTARLKKAIQYLEDPPISKMKRRK